MRLIQASFFACLLPLIVGCATKPELAHSTDDAALPERNEQVAVSEKPTPIQILKNSGLMPDDNYLSADFIPNSNGTMIIADIRDVPCKMIFRYITTTNGDYWMPNQIGCSPY